MMIIPTPMSSLYWEPTRCQVHPLCQFNNPFKTSEGGIIISISKEDTGSEKVSHWHSVTRLYGVQIQPDSMHLVFQLPLLTYIVLAGKGKANYVMGVTTRKIWVSIVPTLCTEWKGASLPTPNENASRHVT